MKTITFTKTITIDIEVNISGEYEMGTLGTRYGDNPEPPEAPSFNIFSIKYKGKELIDDLDANYIACLGEDSLKAIQL